MPFFFHIMNQFSRIVLLTFKTASGFLLSPFTYSKARSVFTGKGVRSLPPQNMWLKATTIQNKIKMPNEKYVYHLSQTKKSQIKLIVILKMIKNTKILAECI